MDNHKEGLSKLCRICSKRAQKRSEISKKVPQKHCLKYKENIKQFYGIDVTTDNSENIHDLNF